MTKGSNMHTLSSGRDDTFTHAPDLKIASRVLLLPTQATHFLYYLLQNGVFSESRINAYSMHTENSCQVTAPNFTHPKELKIVRVLRLSTWATYFLYYLF